MHGCDNCVVLQPDRRLSQSNDVVIQYSRWELFYRAAITSGVILATGCAALTAPFWWCEAASEVSPARRSFGSPAVPQPGNATGLPGDRSAV